MAGFGVLVLLIAVFYQPILFAVIKIAAHPVRREPAPPGRLRHRRLDLRRPARGPSPRHPHRARAHRKGGRRPPGTALQPADAHPQRVQPQRALSGKRHAARRRRDLRSQQGPAAQAEEEGAVFPATPAISGSVEPAQRQFPPARCVQGNRQRRRTGRRRLTPRARAGLPRGGGHDQRRRRPGPAHPEPQPRTRPHAERRAARGRTAHPRRPRPQGRFREDQLPQPRPPVDGPRPRARHPVPTAGYRRLQAGATAPGRDDCGRPVQGSSGRGRADSRHQQAAHRPGADRPEEPLARLRARFPRALPPARRHRGHVLRPLRRPDGPTQKLGRPGGQPHLRRRGRRRDARRLQPAHQPARRRGRRRTGRRCRRSEHRQHHGAHCPGQQHGRPAEIGRARHGRHLRAGTFPGCR